MPPALGETATSVERTPDGRRLLVRRTVDAPIDAVWTVLTDTRRWPDWGPSITAVESADRYITSGSRGRVQVLGAVRLPFEITTCQNYRWTWTVARVPATGHFVETHPAGSVVGFELPLAAFGYVPVCRRACARIGALARTA
ncbi:SRPBCC family protein [Haloarcula laminariae]|uniref:SRPBCC family protein n=1 Tax=Haloarcula laminariae TaxID=2961577 RepID=UPI0021CAA603|nr:SRPBCC family protein [Halomicroarcula laminariae]